MKCHPLRWVWGLIPIAIFSWLAALYIKEPVERDLTARVGEALGNAGLGWANVHFDGRDGILSGQASEEGEPSKAITLANSVYGVRILDGQADLLRKADPFIWAATHASDKVVLTGYVPNQKTHKALLAAVKSQFPRASVEDKLEFARGAPELGAWLDGVKYGLKQLATLKNGKAELSGLTLSMAGEAPSSGVYRSVRTALTTGLPKALTQGTDKVTPPAVSPYEWQAKLADNQLVLTGFVPSDKLRAQMLAEAKQAFGKTVIIDKMDLAEGAPPNWEKATKVSLDQLATLQSGSAVLLDSQIKLSGTAADEGIADATKRAFKAHAPNTFKLSEAITGAKPVINPYAMKIDATASAIDLTGYVPSDAARALLVGAVKAKFPGRTINDKLQLGAGEPAGFEPCMMAAIGGLGRLGNGTASLTGKAVDVSGRTDDEVLAQALAGDVKAAAKGACETKVQVDFDDSKKRKAAEDAARANADSGADKNRIEDERAALAQRDADAAADAKRLAQIASDEQAKKAAASSCEGDLRSAANAGTIQFERASDVLLRQSKGTLRQVAEIASKCQNVLIEIEGHTDSEGVPERNQPLSERRAQSVADFLTDAGVNADRIKAVGYGDTKPVAPTASPENRAKNRRIEFSVKSK